MTVTILGAGAFGTALAIAESSWQDVILWGHKSDHVLKMSEAKTNDKRLPGVKFPENLIVTDDLSSAVKNTSAILFAVPLQATNTLAKEVYEIERFTQ